MVPSCRGLSSPTRPIAPAKLSRISDGWLPESSSANILTLTPSGVATTTDTICSRTVEETHLTDEVPTKTGAAAFKGGTGGGLFPDGVTTKTGAAPWISGWWYLPQSSMSHRFLHRLECGDTSGTFFKWSARKFKPLRIPDAQTKENVALNRLAALTLGEFLGNLFGFRNS